MRCPCSRRHVRFSVSGWRSRWLIWRASRAIGDAAFNEIFHPIAARLLQNCDAVLRVGARRLEPMKWSGSPGTLA